MPLRTERALTFIATTIQHYFFHSRRLASDCAVYSSSSSRSSSISSSSTKHEFYPAEWLAPANTWYTFSPLTCIVYTCCRRIRVLSTLLILFLVFAHTFYFPTLDNKPWSQRSPLLTPGRILPSISIAHRLRSAIALPVDFSSSVANSRSRASARQFVHNKKKVPRNLCENALGGTQPHKADLLCCCCCCCCSHTNWHNQVRGHRRTGSSHSGSEEYPRGNTHKPKGVHA